jgi:hypothetical protein
MEIITKINTIIESCNQTPHQTYYILLQDLSKAYDRVNLDLLELALQRISLPPKFIQIIISLFKNHQNQIIFENHLSDPFDLKTGIIQGEIICPLLWVIYYDPMFQAINETNYGGISLSSSIPKNIYRNDDFHNITINMKLQGYLDDTTWLSDNLTHLEQHLKIADEFYNFANIKINKQKTKLITNNPSIIKNKTIPLQFGNEIVDVSVTPKNSGERILGVYFNPFNNNTFTIKKIFRILNNLRFSISKKKLTHDHIIYIINKVIIPKLEYLTQHFIVPATTCEKFNTIIRSLFKNSLSLNRSTYNSIIHNQLFPNIINFFELQLRFQSSLLIARSHSSLTKDCIKFLFLTSQKKFFYPNNTSLLLQSFLKPFKCFTQIEHLIHISKYYNFSIDTNFSFPIKDGTYPITNYFISDQKYFFRYLKSLTNKQIIFLDQIISTDNAFLETWEDIKKKLHNKRGPKPKWYTFLCDNIVLNPNNLRLNLTLPSPSIQNPIITRPKIPKISTDHVKSINTWISSWIPKISDSIYGRILFKTHFPSCTPMAYIEHWTFDHSFENTSNKTPKSRTQSITPCNGCKLHNTYYIGDMRPKCVLWLPLNNLIIIHLSKYIINNTSPYNNNQLQRKILKKPHSTLRQTTFNDHIARQNLLSNFPSSFPHSNNNTSPLITNMLLNISTINSRLITNLLITDNSVKNQLLTISDQLSKSNPLEIWTDGSLKTDSSSSTQLGFGWVITSNNSPKITFSGSSKYFPSSTKAECLAFLTALIVSAPNSIITIKTDSL